MCPVRRAPVRFRAHGCGVRSARNCSVQAPAPAPARRRRVGAGGGVARRRMARIVLGLIGGVGNMPAAIARMSPTGAPGHANRCREAKPDERADLRGRESPDALRDRTANRVTVNARADTSGAPRLTRRQRAGCGAWLSGRRTRSRTGRATAQRPNEQCHVVRERRFEREWPALRRMLEARAAMRGVPAGGTGRQRPRPPLTAASPTYCRSPMSAMPPERGLDPNLVPFTRVQPYLDECRTRERLNYAIAADRLDAAGIAAMSSPAAPATSGARPGDHATCPLAGDGCPLTTARYTRSGSRRMNCSFSACWVRASLAKTTSPDVSRSMRCTTCGVRLRERRCASSCAYTESFVGPPRQGNGQHAGRLVDDQQRAILEEDLERPCRTAAAPRDRRVSTARTARPIGPHAHPITNRQTRLRPGRAPPPCRSGTPCRARAPRPRVLGTRAVLPPQDTCRVSSRRRPRRWSTCRASVASVVPAAQVTGHPSARPYPGSVDECWSAARFVKRLTPWRKTATLKFSSSPTAQPFSLR